MTSALVPFTFNNVKLFTVTINGKHWTRAKEICKSLKYEKKTGNVIRDHVSNENTRYKGDFISVPVTGTPMKWPVDSQKTDIYINEEAMYELAFTSQQNEAKEFRKYCCNTLFPQIRDHFEQLTINEKDREHQLAIEEKDHQHQLAIENIDREHQQVVEEKDHEIEICQNQIVDLIENRHVPRIGKHDNILCAIQKNEPDELGKPGRHPYYMIRCQRMRLQERLHIKQLQYPNMVIKRPTYDAANAVICWVEFQKYIGKDSYYRNHFSLDNDDHRDFFANTFDIDM